MYFSSYILINAKKQKLREIFIFGAFKRMIIAEKSYNYP